jgi:hypothetical protein
MAEHQFTVTVSGCTYEQAEQVMNERTQHDEDYGFDYTIGYRPQYKAGDPDPTPESWPKDWCHAEDGPTGSVCTWPNGWKHPGVHVAGDSEEIVAVWPVKEESDG